MKTKQLKTKQYSWKYGEDAALFGVISLVCGSDMTNWKGASLTDALNIYRRKSNPGGTLGALRQRVNYAKQDQTASYYKNVSTGAMVIAFYQVMCGLVQAGIVTYPDIAYRLNH